MSLALSTKIYERLAGVETLSGDALTAQGSLATLLATDPDTNKPAVYRASLNEAQKTVSGRRVAIYPCVTFRQSSGIPDRRFLNETGAVERVIYDMEFWVANSEGVLPPSAKTVEEIAEQVEQLLDSRRGVAPVITLSSGKAFDHSVIAGLKTQFDPQLHVVVGLVRYLFVEARY